MFKPPSLWRFVRAAELTKTAGYLTSVFRLLHQENVAEMRFYLIVQIDGLYYTGMRWKGVRHNLSNPSEEGHSGTGT